MLDPNDPNGDKAKMKLEITGVWRTTSVVSPGDPSLVFGPDFGVTSVVFLSD